MDERKKKIGIVTICSLILVAMVVALAIGSRGGKEDKVPEVSSSQKAITTICETTDYQQACLDALNSSGRNSSNPKELIEVAFQAAIKYINEAVKKSDVLKKAQADPRAKSALDSCGELANRAANDLQRSFAKFNNFDIINVDDILLELKIWLSGAITNEQTCLDGFEGVAGDAGQKMRDALKTAMEMTSNSLAMVAEISTFLETMGVQGFKSRRLLSEEFLPVLGHGGEMLPTWMDFDNRRFLTASPQQIRPNLIVAKDGSGKYTTINEALKDIPKNNNKTFVLYIKEGVYEEKVQINSSLTHLMIIGDGPTKTRITGRLNFIDGTGTYQTATVAVQGDDFIARDIGFENSAGPEKHQAVALRVSADRAIFYNCHMDGYQDTLYVHTYRQFYRDCVISGTIDFIFGDSAAVFQGCTLLVRKPLDNQQNIVTAQGRKDVRQPTGLVLQNCTFKADPEYYPFRNKLKSYLGRPWKEYSRTIIMESFVDDFIQPQGWLPWNETFALGTLFYTEFNNRGPGAPKAQRVKWAGVKELPPNRIQRFTAAEFLDGNRWIPPTRVPYSAGFIFPVPKEDPNIKYSPVVPEETKDLGIAVNKASYIATRNNSSSGKNDGSKSPPVQPPPPPPPPPVVVAPPEIAIPLDILPSVSDVLPPSPSPSRSAFASAPTASAPVSGPTYYNPKPVLVGSPSISPSANPITIPESRLSAPPPTTHTDNSVPISQPSLASSPQSWTPSVHETTVVAPPPTALNGNSGLTTEPALAASPQSSSLTGSPVFVPEATAAAPPPTTLRDINNSVLTTKPTLASPLPSPSTSGNTDSIPESTNIAPPPTDVVLTGNNTVSTPESVTDESSDVNAPPPVNEAPPPTASTVGDLAVSPRPHADVSTDGNVLTVVPDARPSGNVVSVRESNEIAAAPVSLGSFDVASSPSS